MIRRAHIRGYKSLQDIEVELAQKLTLVMGPNASGKSNLMDALGLLSRLALSPTLDEAFQDHRGRIVESFTFPKGGLREALQQTSLTFSIEVDVSLSDRVVRETEAEIRKRRAGFDEAREKSTPKVVERYLRYRLTIEYRPQDRILRVLDEQLRALRKDGSVKESRNPFLSTESEGGKSFIRLRMEGQGARPTEYERGLPYTVLSRPHYPPHYPHVEAFKKELGGWRFFYLEPRVMRQDNDLKIVQLPGRHGEDLAAFFDTLRARNPKQFEATSKALHHILPVVEGVEVDRDDDGFLRLIVQEGGTSFTARLMSEGTLRLLGLLAILQPQTPATVIGFEEPENGVHPRRIATVARVLENVAEAGDFQILVNTHSPLLASLLPEPSLLICRKERTGTKFLPFSSPGPLYKGSGIEDALKEPSEETDLLHRIVRGDFGG